MPQPSYEVYEPFKMVKIAASSDALDPRPRRLYIAVSGNINIANDDTGTSTETAVFVVAGTTIECQIYSITALNGGAVVYGLYG